MRPNYVAFRLIRRLKIILLLLTPLLLLTCLFVSSIFFIPNTDKYGILLLPKSIDYPSLQIEHLPALNLRSNLTFELAARLSGLTSAVKSGRYEIPSNANNFFIIRKLSKGLQDPVRLSFISQRTKEDLCRKLAEPLELESSDLLQHLNDPQFLDTLGYKPETIMCLFIPNSYEVYWNIKPKDFIKRMKKEHDKFWNAKRRNLAEAIGLNPEKVSILASIVQAETYRDDERPRIAGVYMNRLKHKWKLNADPTIIFACQDFSIRRVLNKHLKVDSPYNTYLYHGLPPGPINCPSISALEAVLNYERHSYMFFCARDDFSGYHTFTVDYDDHLKVASEYRKALEDIKD